MGKGGGMTRTGTTLARDWLISILLVVGVVIFGLWLFGPIEVTYS